MIDFNHLAQCIKVHENSIHFPYGCEHRVNGKLEGYPEQIAMRKCIELCSRTYTKWINSGAKGDYFKYLNNVYAKDPFWYKDIENKYNH